MKIDINRISEIAILAGQEIMKVYASDDFEIMSKKDNSPLTLADRKSHDLIKSNLNRLYPEIPVISEEDKFIEYELRKNWRYFWLVDPLDGTKEFIHRNGEFTVNIALIAGDTPIAGVIYIPVTEQLYMADFNGAYKVIENIKSEIFVNRHPDKLIVVKSRSHSTQEEDIFYSQFKIENTISAGSSMKFCLVAEGKASLYYRSGPTWEWDTAAGHAIVRYAGGFINDLKNENFIYNKESLLNNGFCVSAFQLSKEYLTTEKMNTEIGNKKPEVA